jgi:DNA adenine methylase
MLEKLEALIPEHQIYMEPFIGSGALALNHIRSPVEIINDLDGDIANLFRVMSDREKGNELIERLSHVAYDRTVFDAAREEQKNNFKGYNSIEKAVLTYIMISQSFNAARSSFSKGGYASTELYHQDMLDNLPRVYERLEHVKIFNVDALDLLECYVDNEKVFAFLDPPYRHDLRGKNANKIYKCELSEIQQIRLLKIIRNAKAKILLCGYKAEKGIDLYDAYLLPYGWKCYKLMDVPKSAQNKATRDIATEYVWCNYELPIWSGYYISLKEYSTLNSIGGS